MAQRKIAKRESVNTLRATASSSLPNFIFYVFFENKTAHTKMINEVDLIG